MSISREFVPAIVCALAATSLTSGPAHAEPGWRTVMRWQEAQAQICSTVRADGTATVRVRMNNRQGEFRVSAGIASVRANGRPDRSLVMTKAVGAGRTSAVVTYDKLTADGRFFVDISRATNEGAGIVKTSKKPFRVSAQAAC